MSRSPHPCSPGLRSASATGLGSGCCCRSIPAPAKPGPHRQPATPAAWHSNAGLSPGSRATPRKSTPYPLTSTNSQTAAPRSPPAHPHRPSITSLPKSPNGSAAPPESISGSKTSSTSPRKRYQPWESSQSDSDQQSQPPAASATEKYSAPACLLPRTRQASARPSSRAYSRLYVVWKLEEPGSRAPSKAQRQSDLREEGSVLPYAIQMAQIDSACGDRETFPSMSRPPHRISHAFLRLQVPRDTTLTARP